MINIILTNLINQIKNIILLQLIIKKVYFGAAGYKYFSSGHKDEARKQRYIDRHKKNESKYWNKSGIDTPSFWSRWLLWNLPTISSSYQDIKKRFNK